MKTAQIKSELLCFTLLIFSPLAFSAWTGNLMLKDANVWPEGRGGNHGVVKYFIDESQNDNVNLEVLVEVWAPEFNGADIQVQTFTNVNRRDYAKLGEVASDVEADPQNAYFQLYDMQYQGASGNNHLFKTTLNLVQCGAFRLTTRFKLPGQDLWQWHNEFADADGVLQRDATIVVSPKKVLNLSIYEVNPLIVEATEGNTKANRSTFEDFTDHDDDGFDPFNIDYVKDTLGFNSMWLMPIFPNTDFRFNSETGQWENQKEMGWPGSPYAAKDYWSVSDYCQPVIIPEPSQPYPLGHRRR